MSTRFNTTNILDTIEMIENYRLDIRTVTMGISLHHGGYLPDHL